MPRWGRRATPTPVAPAAPSHEVTVAGRPVQVRTPPAAVDARLDGHLGRPAFAVRPRTRSGVEVAVPAAAAGFLDVVDRGGREIASGDPAFDTRFRVVGGDPVRVGAELTDPLRTVLLDHDVVFLVVYSGGAWVSVAYPAPRGAARAEQAALQVLNLLVPA